MSLPCFYCYDRGFVEQEMPKTCDKCHGRGRVVFKRNGLDYSRNCLDCWGSGLVVCNDKVNCNYCKVKNIL